MLISDKEILIMLEILRNKGIKKVLYTVIRTVLIIAITYALLSGGGPLVRSREWIDFDTQTRIFLMLNGLIIKAFDLKDLYNDLGIYITDEKYIVSPNNETAADYETDQINRLKQYLDERDIDLVYVNLPTKYTDDNMFFENFGKASYSNRNADLFLQRISSSGIKSLDLRDNIVSENMNVEEMFFRTDHHWTPQTALWAAGKIASFLNERAGYNFDMDLYDPSKYIAKTWHDCWTGEQGRKMSSLYIGRDDFTAVVPNFPTSFDFSNE